MPVPFTEEQIAAIVRFAARELATEAGAVVLMAEVIHPADVETFPYSPWATVGRLHDALGRFWWDVRYGAEAGEFAFVRQTPPNRLGPMGEILPREER